MAGTITANEIASNAIAARHLSANSVNAGHVVSKSLTADKLNINSLSAISANLGTVTAGSIRGVTITGNTISGNTISGGTISGARLEGATGKFTGELEVTQLIGGGVIEQISGTLKHTGSESIRYTYYTTNSQDVEEPRTGTKFVRVYTAKVNISAAPMARYISVDNQPSFILPANQSKIVEVKRYGTSSTTAPSDGVNFMVLSYALSTSRYITIS